MIDLTELEGIKLKVKFKNSEAFITEDKSISIENTDVNIHLSKFQSQAFWVIKVRNVFHDKMRLFCDVISYNRGETDFETHQIRLSTELNQINTVSFKSVNTISLMSTFSNKSKQSNQRSYLHKEESIENRFLRKSDIIKKPIKFSIIESFYFPIAQLEFNDGYVSFKKKFDVYPKPINLTIKNDQLIKEYDAIKNYFENILRVKKVKVSVQIDIEDNEVKSSYTESLDINKINKSLIDEVKFNYIKSTIKNNTKPQMEHDILTVEEYFNTFSEKNFKIKTFYSDDSLFLNDLLRITNTKHYKHLRYLSGVHSYKLMKLRLIHRPFSFMFLIDGINFYHFIWETLNTEEATYIWRTKKSNENLMTFLKKLNDTIKTIKVEGKKKFLNKSSDEFKRIYHDYSDLDKGFFKWKKEIEKRLV